MTALTAPEHAEAPGSQGESLRPVPWRNLVWVIWRQHRLAIGGAGLLLGGLSLVMLINGLLMRSSLRGLGLTACHPIAAPRCSLALQLFENEYEHWRSYLPPLCLFVPVFIGVFAGGPMLAREFESGTFRFAWTQGAGRTRWVVAKLVALAIIVTAMAALFSLTFSWWYEPFFADGHSLMLPPVFPLNGVAFAAWTLAAFALAAFAGVVIRRTVPAMGTAVAASVGLAVATALYLRKNYEAAIVSTGRIHVRSWVLSSWWTGPDGKQVSGQTIVRLVTRHFGLPPFKRSQVLQWLGQHGYTLSASYQPGSRFWHFQLIEGGWLLALALLLGTATVWVVRRRAA